MDFLLSDMVLLPLPWRKQGVALESIPQRLFGVTQPIQWLFHTASLTLGSPSTEHPKSFLYFSCAQARPWARQSWSAVTVPAHNLCRSACMHLHTARQHRTSDPFPGGCLRVIHHIVLAIKLSQKHEFVPTVR